MFDDPYDDFDFWLRQQPKDYDKELEELRDRIAELEDKLND